MITDKEINAFIKKRGIALKGLRRRLRITQKQLNSSSGICQKHISEIENGKTDYTMATYYKYMKGLRK